MRIFVGSTHLKVDYMPAVTPLESGMFVVDASAYRGPLTVNATRSDGVSAVHSGGLSLPATTQPMTAAALGLTAMGGLAVAKTLGASWVVAAGAALGAPILLLGVATLLTRLSAPRP